MKCQHVMRLEIIIIIVRTHGMERLKAVKTPTSWFLLKQTKRCWQQQTNSVFQNISNSFENSSFPPRRYWCRHATLPPKNCMSVAKVKFLCFLIAGEKLTDDSSRGTWTWTWQQKSHHQNAAETTGKWVVVSTKLNMQFEFKKSENYTKQHETVGYFVMPLEVKLTRAFRDFFYVWYDFL